MIDEAFLAILACPVCEDRPPLKQEGNLLVCAKGHRFPVVDAIPHLLPEDELGAADASARAKEPGE